VDAALLASGPGLAAAAASGTPPYLGELVALLVAAGLIGYLSVRTRVVPIVGFLLAGVLIGPHALGLVRQQEIVNAAAEIGVILLLFAIGIEFSVERLARIKRLVLVGGGLQVLLCVALTTGVLAIFHVPWRAGVFTGCLLALSSTAIVLKLLSDRGETTKEHGQLSLALLIFQDLAVVVMVLLVPVLAGSAGSGWALPLALAKAAGIILVVLVVARQIMPKLLEVVARACAPEVFLLAVIAICFGTAYLTSLAGVSVSLGAFLAGLLVAESRHSEHALGEVLPLQILFSATFFVSVGMLLDLEFLVRHLPMVLAGVALVLLVKTVATAVAGRLLGVTLGTVTATALLLAQIGEFSFVLERVGGNAGITPADLGSTGGQAFIATTVVLMVATPWLGSLGDWISRRLDERSRRRGLIALSPVAPVGGEQSEQRRDHIVVSGYGGAARALANDLAGLGVPFTVVTLNPDGAAEAEELGYDVLRGDSGKAHIQRQAGVPFARMVVIPDDNAGTASRLAALARDLNATATIVVRPVDEAVLADLVDAGVDKVVEPERASHLQLSKSVLMELSPAPPRTVADPSRIVRFQPAEPGCPHVDLIRPVLPGSFGCVDCVRLGLRWVHLRVCLSCGHVGCCDSSPGQHARAHFNDAGHPIMASLEPGEDWGWCFLDERTLEPAVEVEAPGPVPGARPGPGPGAG
jgi:CPA2 family monovalent cation:H+ antiporter-2